MVSIGPRKHEIWRADLDGSNSEILVSGLTKARGVALDTTADKIYWADYGSDKIQRANLDGSEVEDLVTTGILGPRGLALDSENGKMYWSDKDTDKIQRANLDGTNIEDLVTTGLKYPYTVRLDVRAEKVYWVDRHTRKIQRANLDGTQVEDLVTLSPPHEYITNGFALDTAHDKMYFNLHSATHNSIMSASLSGENVQTVLSGIGFPQGLALDLAAGQMYFAENDEARNTSTITRANLDGSDAEPLATQGHYASVRLIALDFTPVPEPSTVIMLAMGALGLLAVGRKNSTEQKT